MDRLCPLCRSAPAPKYSTFCPDCQKLCSRCRVNPKGTGMQYCLGCHAAYARDHRPKYADFNPKEKARNKARAYANVYLKRGKIERQGCEVCGGEARMYHEDFSKPLEVRWFCRGHRPS